jgi:hypothetical protein
VKAATAEIAMAEMTGAMMAVPMVVTIVAVPEIPTRVGIVIPGVAKIPETEILAEEIQPDRVLLLQLRMPLP